MGESRTLKVSFLRGAVVPCSSAMQDEQSLNGWKRFLRLDDSQLDRVGQGHSVPKSYRPQIII
jgi:hypothetical protein